MYAHSPIGSHEEVKPADKPFVYQDIFENATPDIPSIVRSQVIMSLLWKSMVRRS